MPSIELNKIAAMMAMKLFAFNRLACPKKKDIVAEFGNLTVESVFEEVIEFPAVVKAEADRIVVTFYGHYREKHKVAVETLLRSLGVTGRSVLVSWLGNIRIVVRFK